METRRKGEPILLGLYALLLSADMAIPYVLGPWYPGYSHLHDTLSTLGNHQSPVAVYAGFWLMLFGLALGCLTILVWRRTTGGRRQTFFLAGILSFAIGAGLIAGIFPEDLPGEAETLDGKFHGIGSGLGSIGLLTGLVAGTSLVTGWKRFLTYGLVTVAWCGFAMFLTAKSPEMFAGVWQKLYLGMAYLAILVIIGSFRNHASPVLQRQCRRR